MALSNVDRSLLRSYPELREMILEKNLEDISDSDLAPKGMKQFNSLDDPETIQNRTALDG